MVPKELLDDLVEGLEALGEALFADFEELATRLRRGRRWLLALVGGLGDGGRADEHEACAAGSCL